MGPRIAIRVSLCGAATGAGPVDAHAARKCLSGTCGKSVVFILETRLREHQGNTGEHQCQTQQQANKN